MENFNFTNEPLFLDEFPLKRITNPILRVNKFWWKLKIWWSQGFVYFVKSLSKRQICYHVNLNIKVIVFFKSSFGGYSLVQGFCMCISI